MPATPAWPPRSAPRLFVDQAIVPGEPVRIEGNQAHYLLRVMRIGPASVVILCDDQTGEWSAIVAAIGKREVVLEPMSKLREREEVPDFWLCPALLKKDRFDLVLEKATELGVARIAPVMTRRCVAHSLNPERARSIVTEAAEQCARTALPAVDTPVTLAQLLAQWPRARTLFFADEQGGEPAAERFAATRGGAAGLLIGPEGGFDDEERGLVRGHPCARAITLGPRILRGETAALSGTALWMGVAGDWVSAR